jgi:hypothetical protein
MLTVWLVSILRKLGTSTSGTSCILHNRRELTTMALKCRVFWDVAPYSLTVADLRFRGAYSPSSGYSSPWWWRQYTSEPSVNYSETTWHYIPEDSKLHTRRCENLKSHNNGLVFKCCILHKIMERYIKKFCKLWNFWTFRHLEWVFILLCTGKIKSGQSRITLDGW